MTRALAAGHPARLLAASSLLALTACASGPGAPDATPAEPRQAPRAAREALRPCARSDVIGAWEVIRMGAARAASVDRSSPEYYPFQRYIFASDATMRYLAARTKITPADHRTMTAEPATTTWAVDHEGRLRTIAMHAPRQEVSACEVLGVELRDDRGVSGMPGDLLLTRFDAEGRAVSRRQLRRLDRPPE